MKQCTVPDCGKKFLARGFCRSHYKSARASGELVMRGGRQTCTADGCDRPAPPGGLCDRDYQRAARAAWEFAAESRGEQPQVASVRTCSKCGAEKSIEEYPRRKGLGFVEGRSPRCRACLIESSLADRAARAEAIKVAKAKWVANNPDLHRRQRRESAMRTRLADEDAFRARTRAKYKENPYPKKLLAHTARVRRRARQANQLFIKFSADQLKARMAYWGNQCYMCGGPFEAIDHVKPIAKGGWHCLSALRPACTSCNSSKGSKWEGPEWAMTLIRSRTRASQTLAG